MKPSCDMCVCVCLCVFFPISDFTTYRSDKLITKMQAIAKCIFFNFNHNAIFMNCRKSNNSSYQSEFCYFQRIIAIYCSQLELNKKKSRSFWLFLFARGRFALCFGHFDSIGLELATSRFILAHPHHKKSCDFIRNTFFFYH